MLRSFALPVVLLISCLVAAQQPSDLSFHDDLLDHLVGTWKVAGIVHDQPSTQTLVAEWVLHHQFLRVYQKSKENIVGTQTPFEGVFFIGYDKQGKRYIAHLMSVFGAHDSLTLGYGERKGDEITFVFKDDRGAVVQHFGWTAISKSWHITSTTSENTKPFIDLTATVAK